MNIASLTKIISHYFNQISYFFNFQEKKIKFNHPLHSSNICSPCVLGELNPVRDYGDIGRTSSWILQVYSKKFHTFSKISHFFNFGEKSKYPHPLRCTAPIYVLSMCNRKIIFVEGLLRYRPYKLMNIASLIKNISHYFKYFSLFQSLRKNKINPSLHSSNICSFHVQEEN